MSNELTKQSNARYVARYQQDGDPFKTFAKEGGAGIRGQRLSFAKGDWAAGTDKTPVPIGTLMLALVHETASRGWVKWRDNAVVDARVEFVATGGFLPRRYELDDLDDETWETDPKTGEKRDPWVRDFRVVLVGLAVPHQEYTFSGGSYGAQLALQALCGAFSEGRAEHPDMSPVVKLGVSSRQSTRYGKILQPSFEIVGWASEAEVRSGKKVGATKTATKPKAAVKTKKTDPQHPLEPGPDAAQHVFNDDLPDWS